MSLLLKDEIITLAHNHNLIKPFNEKCLQSCSYDLRVGAVFKDGIIVSRNHNSEYVWDIAIKPSEIVNMLTLEEVRLPKHIYATVFPINDLSSSGLLILNPGHIDPGYEGPVSICAINLSKETKHIQVGKTKMFTILFDKLKKDSEGYDNDPEVLDLSRKDYEQRVFSTRAQKMSQSIFQLMRENEYDPLLKQLIAEAVKDRFRKYGAWALAALGFLLTIAGVVIAVLAYRNDLKSNIPSTYENKELKQVKDSLTEYKDSLQEYKLLLESIKGKNVNPDTTNRG